MDARLKLPRLDAAQLSQRLFTLVPELKDIAHCDVIVALNRDSAHIGPEEWVALAKLIQSKWRKYDGIVVLHGTDTLAYTASALSFLLTPCLKPVILTGSQRPLASFLTDARRNLVTSVEIAAHGPRTLRQVMTFFDDRLLQGNRSRKRSASEFSAFESPKAEPLAIVGTSIRYMKLKRPGARKSGLKPKFSSNVVLLHVTPGFPAREISRGLLDRIDALVLSVFPSGTAPTHDASFMEMLSQAQKKKVPVVIVSEAASSDHPTQYEAGRALIRAGGIWAGDMTPECAYVKTCLILGQGKEPSKSFARAFARNLASEC